jgi:hypothetical protein
LISLLLPRGPRASSVRGSAARRVPLPAGADLRPSWLSSEAEAALRELGAAYKVEVLAGEDNLYLLGNARKLRGLLKAPWLHRGLLVGAGADPRTASSYAENAEVWDGLESLILSYLGLKAGDEVSDHLSGVVFVPAPGYPQVPVWSVAKGKPAPAKPLVPFRFCDEPVVASGSALGPVFIELPRLKPRLFLSHGISVEALRSAVSCGGLLWPSVALTWKIPIGFGDLVFFFDTQMLTQILKPTGSPSAMKHVYLASTDIWSPRVSDLLKLEQKIDLQRAGRSSRPFQSDFEIDQIRASESSMVGGFAGTIDGASVERVSSIPALAREMARIHKVHSTGVSPYALCRYPYGEMKFAGKVSIGSLPLCVCPSDQSREVEPLLRQAGFRGELVVFPWSKGPRSSWGNEALSLEQPWSDAVMAALARWSQAAPAEPGALLRVSSVGRAERTSARPTSASGG